MITLTNGVQIPENAVQLQTTAAIDGLYVTQPFRLVQYDETLPVAAVQLTYQNQPYTPTTGAELNVRMGKPDGKGVYNPCLGVDSNGVVYFAFTLQMTIVAGYGTLTVEVTDSGVKNSAPIIVDIRRNPVPEGSIESTDEFLTLQEILAEAEKWGQIVQANAANIQEVVDNLEDIQSAAENAQAAAASAAAAQQAAQEAFGFRTLFSAVRPDANGNLDPSRPMTVGPAASVEIESTGDRIQSVTALGFTQQAGTGDPSPNNVRKLTNGGLKLVAVTFDGSGDEGWVDNGGGIFSATAIQSTVKKPSSNTVAAIMFTGSAKTVSIETLYSGKSGIGVNVRGNINIAIPGINTVEAFKAYLQANPLPVWYAPADDSDATGLYAPIILQGGEYRATCLPLTAPLCEGDSVVSWVKSGCDQRIVFDGQQSSDYTFYSGGVLGGNIQRIRIIKAGIEPYTETQNFYSSWLAPVASFDGAYEHFYTGTDFILIYIQAESYQAALEKAKTNPLTIWYRSVNYTEADDIPVSLETHVRSIFEFNQNTWLYALIPGQFQFGVYDQRYLGPNAKTSYYRGLACEAYKPSYTGAWSTLEDFQIARYENQNRVYDSRFETVDQFRQWLSENPVKLEYELATPITYAHPAVILEAATGDQLTYTVTGQAGGQVSVTLKPFQDGGHAKTADSATNAQNAVNTQTADNATQFDGHTWSEVPGQAPVQSVNGKTGDVQLSAANVGAQPAMTPVTSEQTVNGITTTVIRYGQVVSVVYDGEPTSRLSKGSWSTIATGLPEPVQVQPSHSAVSVFTGILYTVTIADGQLNVYPRTDNIGESIRGTFTYISQE